MAKATPTPENERYKGSYSKWVFKDSGYLKFLLFAFGLWGGSTAYCWIDDGAYEPATLFFAIPALLLVYMSYRHWREMVEGRTS